MNSVLWSCTLPILGPVNGSSALIPFPFTPPPLQIKEAQLLCVLYTGVIGRFLFEKRAVLLKVFEIPPCKVLGYWRSKDLIGDRDHWDAFPRLPLPQESLSGFEEGHLGSCLSSFGMVARHLGKWQSQLRKMALCSLKDLRLLPSGAHLPREWHRLEEEGIQRW